MGLFGVEKAWKKSRQAPKLTTRIPFAHFAVDHLTLRSVAVLVDQGQ
jgi:hypothetical protein